MYCYRTTEFYEVPFSLQICAMHSISVHRYAMSSYILLMCAFYLCDCTMNI